MPETFEGTAEEKRALSACIALLRAADSLNSRLSGRLVHEPVTLSQWAVLDALYWSGPMKARDIASKLLKSDGNITYVMDNLEKCEMITKRRSNVDRRSLVVKISAKGREIYERLLPGHVEFVTRLFSVLSPMQQETLGKLSTILREQQE